MQARGMGVVLDQFGNGDNPLGHFNATGPELWEQTRGRITHFVSSMGTTGGACVLHSPLAFTGLQLCPDEAVHEAG